MRLSLKFLRIIHPSTQMEATAPKFELSTKSIFLTYSQCPASRETIRDMLEAKGMDVHKGVIGQEQHADGNLHLHAYIKFDKQVHIRDCRHFDIMWEGKDYHPNV